MSAKIMTANFTAVAVIALFSLQAFLMVADEWVYHRRRGLGRWERWGHPLDSLVYLSALLVPAVAAPRGPWVPLYIVLAVFSCILITKDEWIHAGGCTAGEHWVHAMLFLIHPSILIFTGLLWVHHDALLLRASLPVGIGVFACYQIVREFGRPNPGHSPRSNVQGVSLSDRGQ